MALRFMLQGSRRVRTSSGAHLKLKVGLWGPLSHNLWNPSSSSSSSFYGSSSIPKPPMGGFIKTQDDYNNGATALWGGGTSFYMDAQNDEWIINLAKFAVIKQNENQNAQLQFVRVVGASLTSSSSLLYHITLEATADHKQKIYHAVVWLQLWKNLMELLVWRRVNDALSAVGVKRGDLKLHEAVMILSRKDPPRI